MHFTLVFESHETYDLSYGLVFIPCPVWKKGNQEILNIHPEYPKYRQGDLTPLLELERIERFLPAGVRNAIVIVHDTGHGTDECLALLKQDITKARFNVREVRFDSAPLSVEAIQILQVFKEKQLNAGALLHPTAFGSAIVWENGYVKDEATRTALASLFDGGYLLELNAAFELTEKGASELEKLAVRTNAPRQ